MTTVLIWLGALISLGGVGALGWCILAAMRLRMSEMAPEAATARLRQLGTVNLAAVAAAFLGLALMAAGLIL